MSRARKILFSLATLLVLLAVVEGAARLVWWRLQEEAFAVRKASGEAMLRNDAVNFTKQADGTFGYVLKPGFSRGGKYVNSDGFPQRDVVPTARSPGTIRLAALGESTTQGHDVDNGNYPIYLRRLVEQYGRGNRKVQMLNAGVAGWTSDQVALWAEKKVSAYLPDVVVVYAGWNDFQTYDPFHAPPTTSYIDEKYGTAEFLVEASPLKIVSLASAAYGLLSRNLEARQRPADSGNSAAPSLSELRYASPPDANYKFFIRSADRILSAFRKSNPKVRVAFCTLVGRWPDGTEADYNARQGATWWMKQHGLSPAQAAAALERFNSLIRDYAKSRGLLLIDAERAFSDLERARLQWDFAHMTPHGYEMLAEVMYDALRSAGVVDGERSPRLEQLRNKYRTNQPLGVVQDAVKEK